MPNNVDSQQPSHHSAAPALRDDGVVRLFNQYRFFLIVALGAVYYLSTTQTILGQSNADIFELAHLGYLVTALGLLYLQKINKPNALARNYIENYADIVFICLMMFASGGVQSGFGVLLIVTIALISQLNSVRMALYFAAMASILVLTEEMITRLAMGESAANLQRTALLCTMLMLVAWLSSVPLRRLNSQESAASTADRAALNVQQIASLNEEIIRELDSGVLVLDASNRVLLMNDTARNLLANEFVTLPVHVGQICHNLFASMQEAVRGEPNSSQPFTVETTNTALLPQFIALSSGGMLIRLDDHAHIKQQFQQLKLASLGRLSASIAHEIRNPLGAISHAIQLMRESEELSAQDAELLNIAYRHTKRIDRIVEDVLQLSNRKQVKTDLIDLSAQVQLFCQRFSDENDLDSSSITCNTEPYVSANFDPEHLDQVLWNLCTNARLHNDSSELHIELSCWQSQQGSAIIDIVDNGHGISDIDREQLFEPFYTTHHDGSGLGLYIIRELCELNKAHIECVARDVGAHFRITLMNAQQMAA